MALIFPKILNLEREDLLAILILYSDSLKLELFVHIEHRES